MHPANSASHAANAPRWISGSENNERNTFGVDKHGQLVAQCLKAIKTARRWRKLLLKDPNAPPKNQPRESDSRPDPECSNAPTYECDDFQKHTLTGQKCTPISVAVSCFQRNFGPSRTKPPNSSRTPKHRDRNDRCFE